MRLQTLLSFATLSYLAFAITDPTNLTNPENHQAKIVFKRHGIEVSLEQTYSDLRRVISDLKEFVHDDYVEINRFCTSEADLKRRLEIIKPTAQLRTFPKAWRNEYIYATFFFDCMREVSSAFSQKCEYWGSDLVSGLGKLSVQILNLFELEGDKVSMGKHRQIARFEDRFGDLQYRLSTDVNIPDMTRDTIVSYETDVEKALNITKNNLRFNKARAGGIYCRGGYIRRAKDI